MKYTDPDGRYIINNALLENKTTSGIVAYAGEEEIILSRKIDQTKINEIANYSINTVMEWDNDTQNIDNN